MYNIRAYTYAYCLTDMPALALLVHARVYACCIRSEESYVRDRTVAYGTEQHYSR